MSVNKDYFFEKRELTCEGCGKEIAEFVLEIGILCFKKEGKTRLDMVIQDEHFPFRYYLCNDCLREKFSGLTCILVEELSIQEV